MEDSGHVPIRSEGDLVEVRKKVREAATALGFGITDVTRIVTAASELARNVYLYAGSGALEWSRLNSAGGVGLELVFVDSGPGIPDTAMVMQQGYSTSGGLGLGLPGARRLMDEFEIESAPGRGTKVTVRKWLAMVTTRRS